MQNIQVVIEVQAEERKVLSIRVEGWNLSAILEHIFNVKVVPSDDYVVPYVELMPTSRYQCDLETFLRQIQSSSQNFDFELEAHVCFAGEYDKDSFSGWAVSGIPFEKLMQGVAAFGTGVLYQPEELEKLSVR